MLSTSLALKTALLGTGSVDSVLDGFFIYIFKGPVPATADAVLDMVGQHTQLAVVSLASGGVSGGNELTFGSASAGSISKAAGTWSGPIVSVGAAAGGAPTTHTPTFMRLCNGLTDTGRTLGGGTDLRMQLTCGSTGIYDIYVPDLVDDGAAGNTVGWTVFNVRVDS